MTWAFDEAQSLVTTRFAFTTRAFEGREEGTLTALYPHQWQDATAQFIDKSYGSVRGPMKLVKGVVIRDASTLSGNAARSATDGKRRQA